MNRLTDIVYLNLPFRTDRAMRFNKQCADLGFPKPYRYRAKYWKDYGVYGKKISLMIKDATDWARPLMVGFQKNRGEHYYFYRKADYVQAWQYLECFGYLKSVLKDGQYGMFCIDDAIPNKPYGIFENVCRKLHPFDMLIISTFGDERMFLYNPAGDFPKEEISANIDGYPEICKGFGNTDYVIIVSPKGCNMYRDWQIEYREAFLHTQIKLIGEGKYLTPGVYHLHHEELWVDYPDGMSGDDSNVD